MFWDILLHYCWFAKVLFSKPARSNFEPATRHTAKQEFLHSLNHTIRTVAIDQGLIYKSSAGFICPPKQIHSWSHLKTMKCDSFFATNVTIITSDTAMLLLSNCIMYCNSWPPRPEVTDRQTDRQTQGKSDRIPREERMIWETVGREGKKLPMDHLRLRNWSE